jgi:hypothetical protein
MMVARLFTKEKNQEHTRDPKYAKAVKEKINQEMDIVRLIKTINKLKATVSCLVDERKDRDQLIKSAAAINKSEMTVSLPDKKAKSKFERFIDDTSSSDESPEPMVQSTTPKEKTSLMQYNQAPNHSLYSEASPCPHPPIAHTEHFQSSSKLPFEKSTRNQSPTQPVYIPFQSRDGSETKRDKKSRVTSIPNPLPTH